MGAGFGWLSGGSGRFGSLKLRGSLMNEVFPILASRKRSEHLSRVRERTILLLPKSIFEQSLEML